MRTYTTADNAGAPFGPNGLIEWTGPEGIPIMDADKHNAVAWVDDKGYTSDVPQQPKRNLTALYHSQGFKEAGLSDFDRFGSSLVGLARMQNLCHFQALNMGWWDKETAYRFDPFLWKLALAAKHDLIHSELSEALEGLRKDKMDDHLPHRTSFEVELADAVIRIFDLAGMCDLNLAEAIVEKLNYNLQRVDHTREARAAAGGKAF